MEQEYGLGRGRTDLLIVWPQPGRERPGAMVSRRGRPRLQPCR